MDIPTTIPMDTGNQDTMYRIDLNVSAFPADKLYSASQSAEGTDWNAIILASVGTFSSVLLVAAAALSAAMCVWLCSRRRSRCLSAIHSLCMRALSQAHIHVSCSLTVSSRGPPTICYDGE